MKILIACVYAWPHKHVWGWSIKLSLTVFFRYIIVVEHDLSVLDYLSDFICCLYGVPSAYGVVTMPFSVREGNSCHVLLFKPTKNSVDEKIFMKFIVWMCVLVIFWQLKNCCSVQKSFLFLFFLGIFNSFSLFVGINIFLDGYVPTENLRFRDASLVFKVAETANEEEVKKMCMYKYPGMKKKMGEFELSIVAGEFTDSEIMVMLGENGKWNSC